MDDEEEAVELAIEEGAIDKLTELGDTTPAWLLAKCQQAAATATASPTSQSSSTPQWPTLSMPLSNSSKIAAAKTPSPILPLQQQQHPPSRGVSHTPLPPVETQRDRFGAAATSADLPSGAAASHRRPPPPPQKLTTMRMEDMLRKAMTAAATDVSKAKAFDEILSQYVQHPGVRRRKREAAEAERLEHERCSRAFYWSEMRRVPKNVNHRTSSLDALVDAGCSWELAHELFRFPILRLLPYAKEQLDGLPIHELLQFNIDRKMNESQARACIYFAIDRLGEGGGGRQHPKTFRQMNGVNRSDEWLSTQRRIFAEMVERGFAPPSASKVATTSEAADAPADAPQKKQKKKRIPAKPPPLPLRESNSVNKSKDGDTLPYSATTNTESIPSPVLPSPPVRQPSDDDAAVIVSDGATLLPPSPILPPTPFVAGGGATIASSLAPTEPAASPTPPSPLLDLEILAPPSPVIAPPPTLTHVVVGGGETDRGDVEGTELLELIGQGTYGAVFRGERNGEAVAVKVLSLNKETAEEVRREIALMRACECEHIVAYKGCFHRRLDGRMALHLVMELAELGSTLDVIKRRGNTPMPERAIDWIVLNMLKALHYMHTVAAIHRDVKAANVLVMTDGRVKLADLGVAAQLQRTMSKRGTMIGTPHWMAPEAFNPEGEQPVDASQPPTQSYDSRVDIWSLGITAIELAEGVPPLADNKSVFQVMLRIVSGPPPTLKDETEASETFRAFVGRALVKEPERRPAASELLLDDFVAGATREALMEVLAETPSADAVMEDGDDGTIVLSSASSVPGGMW